MNIFDAHISGALSVSGSGEISNDLLVSGNLTVLGWISGSVSGNITSADTASYAPKYTLTSSFNTFTSSYNTGSFTGSFIGNGSGLYNIPASGVTGLNLTQIADGSATASISQPDGLRINTNTEITGTLKVTGDIFTGGQKVVSAYDQLTGSYDQRYVLSGSITQTTWDNIGNKPSGIVSGSVQVEITGSTGYSTFSSSIATTDLNQNNRLDSIETSTGSLNSYTSSTNARLGVVESTTSSLNTFTASANGKLTSLESASSSIRSDFNSYTSSTNSDLTAIHTLTSSLNTFSSSILGALEVTGSDLTVKGNLLVKGTTTQIDSTTINIGDNIISLNGTATNNGGIIVQDALGASNVSGSLLWDTAYDYWKAGKQGSEERIILNNEYNTFSTSIDSRSTSLESSRTSLNSYTSSNDTRLGVIESTTSSLNTYTSSTNTRLGIIEGTTASLNSFTSSADGRIGALETASGSIRTDFNSYTSSNNNRVNTIETSTGSLNTFTASASNRLNSLETASGSIRTDFNSYTSSTNNRLNTIESTTSSLNSYTSSNTTNINAIHTATSSLNSYTSSANIKLGAIETATSSLNSFTSSIDTTIKNKMNTDGVISGSIQVNITGTTGYSTFSGSIATTDSTQNDRITALELMTGSYATTGSSNIVGNQTITGSVFITQNLTVLGSSSFLYLTASQLAVSSAFISVNVFEPMERFGGIHVYDSGSSNATASLIWDSQNNKWIYQNSSDGTYSGGMLMMGPRNTGSLGSEVGTIANVIMKGMGGDHISGSNITDDGSNVRINSNTIITGSLVVTSTVSSTNITAIESTTASLNTFTSSATTRLSAIESTTSSLNTYTSSNNTRLGTIETSTSSLNTFTSSASSRLNSVESTTASLNTFTSSANSRLNSLETASGSIRSDFNSYTSSANNRLSAIETSTSSLNTFTSSASSRLGSIETSTSSLNTFTSSASSRLGALETSTSSLNSYTSSNTTNINAIHTATSSLNTFTSSASTRLGAIETSTSSLNTFTNSFNTAISLSGADVTVKGNFTVSGTTTTVNSTTVSIGDNIIALNGTGATNAGLVVRDATAPNTLSGSLLWDTTNDKWIAGTLGAEDDIVLRTATQTLTNKTINASQLVDASVSNAKLANSSTTIGTTAISLGSSSTTLAGLTSVTSTTFVGALSGNASTATSASYASTATSSSYAFNATSSSYATVAAGALTAGSATSATTAGSVTNSVTFTNTGGALAGTTYNGGTARTIDYSTVGAAPAAGSSSIVTVGTITSGTWTGTAIAVANGGTGATTAAGARTNLGLVIGTDVLAYRTFGTAANSATGDFATAAQGTTADNALPKAGGTMTGNISFTNTTSYGIQDVGATAWIRPRDTSNNLHIRTSSGGIYLDTDGTHYFRNTAGTNRAYIDGSNGGGRVWDSGNLTNLNQLTNGPGYITSSGTAAAINQTVAAPNEANLVYSQIADNDFFRIRVGGSSNAGWVELATADDGTEPIYLRQYTGTFTTVARTATLLDGSGNTSFPGSVTASSFSGTISGSNVSGNISGNASNITSYTINQSVGTSNSPTFAGITINSSITASGGASGGFLSATYASGYNRIWAFGNATAYGLGYYQGGTDYIGFHFGNTSSPYFYFYQTGNMTISGVFTENSSIRYKKDIETIKYGLDKVLQMRGVTYVKKDNNVKEIGVIAEEMNEVLPDVVLKNEEGQVDSVSYSRLSAVFIEAIKELKQEINEQNLIISELKHKLGE